MLSDKLHQHGDGREVRIEKSKDILGQGEEGGRREKVGEGEGGPLATKIFPFSADNLLIEKLFHFFILFI